MLDLKMSETAIEYVFDRDLFFAVNIQDKITIKQ